MYLSLVTFGSPPVIDPQGSFPTNSSGLVINIVNEYDLVTRADGPYVRSLVDLYRSIYKLPPIQDNLATDSPISLTQQPDDPSRASTGTKERVWTIPRPSYRHVGECVLLRLGQRLQTEIDEGANDSSSQFVLTAWSVDADEFASLLFCRVLVHRRVHYQERIEQIAGGCFNGRNGWQDNPLR